MAATGHKEMPRLLDGGALVGEMADVTLGDWGHGGAAVRGRQCKKGNWLGGKAVSGSSHTSLGSQGEGRTASCERGISEDTTPKGAVYVSGLRREWR